jgi:hypothetical protein
MLNKGSTDTATSSCVTDAEACLLQAHRVKAAQASVRSMGWCAAAMRLGCSDQSPVWVVSESTAMGLANNRER